jgi:membrane fusion protein, heavy metal efflux system
MLAYQKCGSIFKSVRLSANIIYLSIISFLRGNLATPYFLRTYMRLIYSLIVLIFSNASSLANPSAQLKSSAEQEIVVTISQDQVRAAGIETEPIEPETGINEIVVPGVVTVPPQQLRIVAAPAAGLVETLLVSPDELIKEGDPIATLKSPDLVEQERAFLHALSEANLASEKLRRDEQLFKEHIIAERRVIVTRAETSQALSALDERSQILTLSGMSEQDITKLKNERRLSSFLTVRSPIEGTILNRHGTTGERVQASAPLVTIARLDPIWVDLQVPLSKVGALEHVDKVHLAASGLDGQLIRIGRTVDAATQSVAAVAEFYPGKNLLRPGQAVQAKLYVVNNGQEQWRVNADAVVSHQNRSWVFVRIKEGFRATPVIIVSETPHFASLQGKLTAGERVATRGLLTLLAELAEFERQ